MKGNQNLEKIKAEIAKEAAYLAPPKSLPPESNVLLTDLRGTIAAEWQALFGGRYMRAADLPEIEKRLVKPMAKKYGVKVGVACVRGAFAFDLSWE